MSNRLLSTAVVFVLGTATFALIYGQAPLYYSNQNQYFLHGLAEAGVGHLDEDWLANTIDPTPVFSCLVRVTALFLPPFVFHVYYALLLGVYLACMVGVFRYLAREFDSTAARWGFVVLIVLIHSASLRWLSYHFLGLDYPWYFQSGVAGQYTLGAMLQPSTFGVFLIASVVLFVLERPVAAILMVGLTVTLHATYLLAGGLFTFSFLCVLWAEKKRRLAIGLGVLALALVAPTVIYVLMAFQPTSPEQFAEGQRILAQLRLPHHCLPRLWFDPIAGLQVAWIVVAAVLARKTRLFLPLVIPLVLGASLTVLQVVTSSDTLSLLFPWRISAFLVPLATAIVLSRLVMASPRWWGHRTAQVIGALTVVALVAGGVTIMATRSGYRSNDDETAMMDHVREHRSPGEMYLLPVVLQDLQKNTYGSKSSDFQPLAVKKGDAGNIKVDLQRFRLYTGSGIYVDFKSMPYKDMDLLEWHERMKRTMAFYSDMREGRDVRKEMSRHGITHVVVESKFDFSGLGLKEEYKDTWYRVYRVLPGDTSR